MANLIPNFPDYDDMMMLFTLWAFRRHGALLSIPFKTLHDVVSSEIPSLTTFSAMTDCLGRLRKKQLVSYRFTPRDCNVELTSKGLEEAQKVFNSRMVESQ